MEPLPNDEVDDAPSEDQGAQQVPLHASQVGDAVRDPQHSPAEMLNVKAVSYVLQKKLIQKYK